MRASKPDQKIVFTSGHVAPDGDGEGPTYDAFIAKPYTRRDLAEVLDSLGSTTKDPEDRARAS